MDESMNVKIFRYIVRFKRHHDGNSPTYREIMAETGISSTSTVAYHLSKLEEEGRIRRARFGGNARVIQVVGGEWVGPGKYQAVGCYEPEKPTQTPKGKAPPLPPPPPLGRRR